MAYLLLKKPIILRPLAKIARTEADIENVREADLSYYFVAETSDANVNPLIYGDKVLLDYNNENLNIVDNPDGWGTLDNTVCTFLKNNYIKEHKEALINIANGDKPSSNDHKIKIETSLASLESLDVSTMGTFSYSFLKKAHELGHSSILSSFEL